MLYRRHHRMALQAALRAGVPSGDAEDVVAEAYAKVLRAVQGGRGPTRNFPGYLATAVKRVAWSVQKQSARYHPTDDVDLLDDATGPGYPEDLTDSLAGAALAALPSASRRLLWRVEVQGDSIRDIARELGKTPNSVSAATFRARKQLRTEYLRRAGVA